MTSFKVRKRHLRLDHPEFRQVTARLRFLGAEGRTEAVDATEGHRVCFVVQLPALRQVGRLVVEVLRAGRGSSVPSHAAGVKIGVSARMNPRSLKKSRTALMISCRTRRIACWRSLRIQR